jgi:hypothetical protein
MAACSETAGPGAYTHLIVLGSEAERAGMLALTGDAWVGLTDRITEGVLLPVTTEDVGGYPIAGAWAGGEPNDQGGDEDCLQTYVAGQLNDTSCDAVLVTVCECDGFPLAPSHY